MFGGEFLLFPYPYEDAPFFINQGKKPVSN